jgi:hypothetical protein
VSDKQERARHIWQPVVDRLEGLIDDHVHEAIAPLTQRIEQHEHRLTELEQQVPGTEAMMSDESKRAEQEVNDTTPTNEPGRTPADSDLSPNPDDRGKTTQTGDEGDVPEDVRKRLREETGRDRRET